MQLKRPVFTALISSALFVACGDSNGDRNDSGTVLKKDSGSSQQLDGGTTPPDSGTIPPDGGPGFDSGVPPGPCDPVTASGCTAPQICVWVQNLEAAQCRDPAAQPVTHEQQCDAAQQNCQAGYTCVQLPGSANTTCIKVCDSGDNADCAGLVGVSQNGYSCGLPLSQTQPYWACTPTPMSCEPFNDQCMAGEYCQVVDAVGNTGCIPEGTATVGTSCGQVACMKGGICLDFGNPGDPSCYEPCDSVGGGSCANPGDLCSGFTINQQPSSFGICSVAPAGCLPFQPNDCPANENCEVIGSDGTTGCVPAGTAGPGQSCGQATGGCQKGSICLNLGQPGDPKCYEPCDTVANPTTCSAGTCGGLSVGNPPTNLPFGICG
jgi:hypothetical protein